MSKKGPILDYKVKKVSSIKAEIISGQQTFGQKLADTITEKIGSWYFITIQSSMLLSWVLVNVYLAVTYDPNVSWDPYPFILLNLLLSFQAAYTGPIVMMSQNRHSQKDSLTTQYIYEVDKKAEEDLLVIMKHLVHQDELIVEILEKIDKIKEQETKQ